MSAWNYSENPVLQGFHVFWILDRKIHVNKFAVLFCLGQGYQASLKSISQGTVLCLSQAGETKERQFHYKTVSVMT